MTTTTATATKTLALARLPQVLEIIRRYPSPDGARALSAYPKVRVVSAYLGPAGADYNNDTHTLRLSYAVDVEPNEIIAIVLFHELIHADNAAPVMHQPTEQAVDAMLHEEATATVLETKFSRWLNQQSPLPTITELELQIENKLKYLARGEQALYRQAIGIYADSITQRVMGIW